MSYVYVGTELDLFAAAHQYRLQIGKFHGRSSFYLFLILFA